MLKFILVLGILCIGLFAVSQVWMKKQLTDIETYSYEVIKSYEGFELRQYESANFAYVTMPQKTYDESSSQGFQMLAGYIFGGNDRGQKIAMTSPVSMSMSDSVTMMFMVPAEYTIDELPVPNNSEVKFKNEPGKKMAAIRFGGWANNEKIKQHKDELKRLLEKEGISHTNDFSYLGYNAPYEVVNRRNEVVVVIE